MSSTQASFSINKLVLWPAILTLIITLVRLMGELNGWPATWFSIEAGGGAAIMGISWLMPIFGLYFGWRLARARRAPAQMGMPILLCIIAIGASVGAVMGIGELTGLGPPSVMKYVGPALLLLTLLIFAAWPALFFATLVYGLYARIPVVIITYLATSQGWDTHHVKLAPGSPEMPAMEAAHWLSFAQLTLWVPATIMIGGLFGCIAGATAKKL